VEHTPGGGLTGVVDGRRVMVGSPRFVAARTGKDIEDIAVAGTGTPVWVAVDGRVVAHARFDDPVRADAAAALAALRARGWHPRLLSGDHPEVAAVVGRQLGFEDCDVRGGATPEDKLAAIEAAAREGPVVMVGDGVNDAAAIARATVGVGVRGGAEACLAAADVFLTRPGLMPLVALATGSARTLRVIRRTLAWSVAYNVVGAALAIAGLVTPLIAALLMPASSLTVVLASRLGRTFDDDPSS
jgi:Cu2+-exporting ATPase